MNARALLPALAAAALALVAVIGSGVVAGAGTPTYQCPYTHRWVAVALRRAVHHGATLFYTRMKWAYFKRGVRHVQLWYFKTYPGASVPTWQR